MKQTSRPLKGRVGMLKWQGEGSMCRGSTDAHPWVWGQAWEEAWLVQWVCGYTSNGCVPASTG